ncbi:MAG: UDP-glucose/GDP-mannose dehydrogenase family protein [Candidatus Omnitrophica bacterium]|nr:UDP-glucose/GDP-mannose dehydrogenase family protein [Candidatus Omnitrophota bacterium]
MDIAIVGSGYVGLVTGVCLAHIGHNVVCCDNNEEKIKALKAGKVPIYEPGLDELLEKYRKSGRITFTSSIAEAAKKATVIFIAVGTPSKKNGDADLTYIENVAREVAQNMDSYKLLVEKSTVPAQTGDRIARTIRLNLPAKHKQGKNATLEFDVASNPEFLREGSAVEDFMNPDRIVIGVESKRAERLLRDIYKPLKATIVVTNLATAEMIKHASNSFLATKISFINSVAQICDRVGADVEKVAEGMGYDKRIGRSFLNAGIGYGGSCFPKDVDAFVRLAEKSGYDFKILKSVRDVNEQQKEWFVRHVEDKLWIVKDKTIAVWGLAFKSNTDDMRSAASLTVIEALQDEGARIQAYDPQAMPNAKKMLKGVKFCDDPYAAAKGADCLLLITEWDEFRQVDLAKTRDLMRQAVVFDGRNFLDARALGELGYEYYGIGRGGNA